MASTSDETRPLLADNDGTTVGGYVETGTLPEKKRTTPLPKLQIAALLMLAIVKPICSQSIFPYINQLVSELDITGGDEKKVGYYAGLIESIFFATEALFVFQWSWVSDHVGRKPVLLIGVGGLGFSMMCFGLSRTFWGLVVSRSLVGLLNGNTGVMKSMMAELTDTTNIAQGFALFPITWAVGSTIGPMMGGQLVKPHDRWPNVFSHPFWTSFPYFLPSGVSAAFCAITFVACAIFLKETLPRRRLADPSSCDEAASGGGQDDAPPPLRTILTWPVFVAVANYGVLALIEIAFLSLVPLFFATPIHLGGLGLPPSTIGIILGTVGVMDGVFQALFFAKAVDTWGPKRVFQLGLSMFVPLYALLPLMNVYARAYGVTNAVWAMVLAELALIVVMDMSFGSIFMFVTSSAPSRRTLGAVNGVAQFCASVARAIGPAAATSLFATSLERNWLGGYAVYLILVACSIALFFASVALPRDMWPKENEREGSDTTRTSSCDC